MPLLQLHLMLKHDHIGGLVQESVTAPTSVARAFIRNARAAVMLIDLNKGVSVTNGAVALAGYIATTLSLHGIEQENICWVYRDSMSAWNRFEIFGTVVSYAPVPGRDASGAVAVACQHLDIRESAEIQAFACALPVESNQLPLTLH